MQLAPKAAILCGKSVMMANRPFKVIQGHWFWYQLKAPIHILLVNNTNLYHLSSRTSYCGILLKLSLFTGVPLFHSLIWAEPMTSALWNLASKKLTSLYHLVHNTYQYTESFRHGSPVWQRDVQTSRHASINKMHYHLFQHLHCKHLTCIFTRYLPNQKHLNNGNNKSLN